MSFNYDATISDRHIRLLYLYPGELADPIECSLRTVAVGQNKSIESAFEALSYVWGPSNDRRYVTCNEKTLSITRDLQNALRHLRLDNESRTMWIDQLCINQQDLNEKSAQVQLMGSIYRSAKRVIVWLGDQSETSEMAMRFLPGLEAALSTYHGKSSANTIFNAQLGQELKSTHFVLPPCKAAEWTSLSELFARPWFRRLWIVQEVVLGQEVQLQCGRSNLPWSTLEQLMKNLDQQLYLLDLISKGGAPRGLLLFRNIQALRDRGD